MQSYIRNIYDKNICKANLTSLEKSSIAPLDTINGLLDVFPKIHRNHFKNSDSRESFSLEHF